MSKFRIAPRAAVDPEVLDVYRSVAEDKVRSIYRQVEGLAGSRRDTALARFKLSLTTLAPIVRGDTGAGRGLDLVRSRLRALDYEKIYVKRGFIIALTRDPFILEEVGSGTRIENLWDTGPYAFCLPVTALATGSIRNLHFIPQRNVYASHRHPHHYAADRNPDVLLRETNTCWSQFASPMSAAMQDADLVEVLRMGRIFLGRGYNGSFLVNPHWSTEMNGFMRLIDGREKARSENFDASV